MNPKIPPRPKKIVNIFYLQNISVRVILTIKTVKFLSLAI